MRFGHCKTCWQWKEGFCYAWHNRIEESSYCPDHWNRKKGNKEKILDDWIKRNKKRGIKYKK